MLARRPQALLRDLAASNYICTACSRTARAAQADIDRSHAASTTRRLHIETQTPPASIDDQPFRKSLKDALKQQKKETTPTSTHSTPNSSQRARLEKWDLTVGLEIHAELNTARKLFSSAATSINEAPNTHVALFDTALPGTQPIFQKETLLPAIRAALAFQCTIQRKSSFDRKHYFYHDQPAGYQITQYYEPFAKDGKLVLYPHDFPPGTNVPDAPIEIGIRQVQMEQDTAKTISQPPSTYLLDYNRVSHPLIEIITLPELHDPVVAAAAVKKIQKILKAVDACTTGMELGGLRADVNVSVRERSSPSTEHGHSYHGVAGLGQRTEIKNLASVKAVEDAIIAERDRQIDILENGGTIRSETRGWTVGSKTTSLLRSKEGEVDYRYMPDPDIPPILVSQELIDHLSRTLPHVPDRILTLLTKDYTITTKDALTLLALDSGSRIDYILQVAAELKNQCARAEHPITLASAGQLVANWVLMDLGALFSGAAKAWDQKTVPAQFLACTLSLLVRGEVSGSSARFMLGCKFAGDQRTAEAIWRNEGLKHVAVGRDVYIRLAQAVIDDKPDMVRQVVERKQVGKVGWFVGEVMRRARMEGDGVEAKGEGLEAGKKLAKSARGEVDPKVAESVIKELLGLEERSW